MNSSSGIPLLLITALAWFRQALDTDRLTVENPWTPEGGPTRCTALQSEKENMFTR